jgi:coenzyme F420-0:L-glutamate ligase/coenzyme F420-1:gamma-L-glutamate ligase
MGNRVEIIGLSGIPEVTEGDDIGRLIIDAAEAQGVSLEPGDVIVVKQKIVSKAEGRIVKLVDVAPSPLALQIAKDFDKDPRHVEVVLRESRRIVKMDMGLIISETRNGLVCANAGVDASNVGVEEALCLLPEDPDGSAHRIRTTLEGKTGGPIGVIVSDSIGRPWRNGIVDLAIGVSGLESLRSYVGQADDDGYELKVTVVAVADELASAAELVTGKVERSPVAVLKGYAFTGGGGGAGDLVMDRDKDLFR